MGENRMEFTINQLGIIRFLLQENNIRLQNSEYRLLSKDEIKQKKEENKAKLKIIDKKIGRVKL